PGYFLIVTGDRVFLWKNRGIAPEVLKPDFELDAQILLKPYLTDSMRRKERVSREAFELIVASWLGDLTRLQAPVDRLPPDQKGLVDSGFLNAVRGGRVDYGVAV